MVSTEQARALQVSSPRRSRATGSLPTLGGRGDDNPTGPEIPRSVAPPDRIHRRDGGGGGNKVRVAILSFLFNWPSTGGGTVHTFELAVELARAGFEVRHIYARFDPWEIGRIVEPLPYPVDVLEFSPEDWHLDAIRARFRAALDDFDPDRVIITDSWNSKPLLAEAARDYPTILRFQASECLCPLNNVRLLPGPTPGRFAQCANHQLASPGTCVACVEQLGHCSGGLHRAERALVGFGTVEHHHRLLAMFRDAQTTLVVNPLMEAMVGPYTAHTRVVTAGMDPARFADAGPPPPIDGRPLRLLFAGLTDEPMKGFDILHQACALLWEIRQDFELIVTADPPGPLDDFTRRVGWQSQADLPARIAEADIVVVPTVAQEALGRTAVEAMAGARPVVASRIGGLSFTVLDGATGVLVDPEDPAALADALAGLLDDPGERARMGAAGRRKFLETYAWPVIIERAYRPILAERDRSPHLGIGFAPTFHPSVGGDRLAPAVADYFGLGRADVARMYRSYLAFHHARGYEQTLGEIKTLCLDEAFLLCVTLSVTRPRAILVLEGADGRSLRRIVDMRDFLGLDCQIIAVGAAEGCGLEEVQRIDSAPGGRIAELVDQHSAELIFLDRHEFPLVREVVALGLSAPGPLSVALHDCSTGLCNPGMDWSEIDAPVTSQSGVWQRHVLAEAVGVADPLSPQLDDWATAEHRLRIFETPHGLALLTRRGVVGVPV